MHGTSTKVDLTLVASQLSDLEALIAQNADDLGSSSQCRAIHEKLLVLSRHFEAHSQPDPAQEQVSHIKKVLDSLPLLVSYMDRELRYKYVNATYQDWFGVSHEECLRSSMGDIVGGAGIDAVRPYLNAAFAGVEQSFEREIPYKRGRIRYMQIKYVPHLGRTGEVEGLLVIAHDISERHRSAMQLEAERAHLKQIINGVPVLISQWDRNLINIAANDMYFKFFGKTPAQLVGTHYRDLLGRDFDNVLPHIQKALAGKTQTFDYEIFVKDGTLKRIQVTYHPDMLGNEVVGLFTIAADVTEQHNAAFRFEQMAKAIGEVFWMTDPVKQKMVYISPGYEKVWGKTCAELYLNPQSFVDSIHPDDRGRVCASFANQALGTYNERYRIVLADGATKWIHDVAYPIHNQSGAVQWVVGVAQDITEIVLKEREISSQNELLQAVLQNSPSSIIVRNCRANLSISLVNNAAKSMLGIESEAYLGTTLYDLLPHAEAERLTKRDQEAVRSKKITRIDQEVVQTKAGSRLHRTFLVPTFDTSGAANLLIQISSDITDEVQATTMLEVERLKSIQSAKLASLGEMSAGIAHEINNPLAIIVSSLPLLSKFINDPAKFQSKIESIGRSAERIGKIVRGLKKFSRTSGETVRKSVVLAETVRESMVLLEGNLKRQSTSIVTDLRSESHILCDEVEVEQVIINLVNNAIDAVKDLPERWIKIALFEDGSSLVLQIRDSGHGIPPEVKRKLFQPFFTTKKVGEGTGLGLSIVKGILDDHGATIVLNECETHTCFELRFQRTGALIHAA